MPDALEPASVRQRLAALPHWTFDGERLRREFRFDGFSRAFGFLARVALLAEAHGHHPEIHNSYATVVLELLSHDAGGVTERDLEMARAIDAL